MGAGQACAHSCSDTQVCILVAALSMAEMMQAGLKAALVSAVCTRAHSLYRGQTIIKAHKRPDRLGF